MLKLSNLRPSLLGLRARTTLALAISALMVSMVVGVLTYQLAKSYLISQRVELAQSTAFLHAADLDASLSASPGSVDEVLSSRSDASAVVLVRDEGAWFGAVVGIGERDIDADLRNAVAAGSVTSKVQGGDQPAVVVGLPLPGSGAEYYEIFELTTLQSTLGVLRTVLVAAGAIATLAGAVFGLIISRRVTAPLRVSADAAKRIAAGDLGIRLSEDEDPELTPLFEAFNDMATSLEERVVRERRFSADVSHELRTPLTALDSAVNLLDRRTDEMSETSREAFESIKNQIAHFNELVLEILDLSRMEAGIADVQVEPIQIGRFLDAVLSELHVDPSIIELASDLPPTLLSDPRRLRVVFRNIVQNAANYAGGIKAVHVNVEGDHVLVCFDDSGPGLTRSERVEVFERFRRGSATPAPDAPRGTGLGLSMSKENMRLLGGSVTATESPLGGARFVVAIRSVGFSARSEFQPSQEAES